MIQSLTHMLAIFSLVMMCLAAGQHAHAETAAGDSHWSVSDHHDPGETGAIAGCDQCERHMGCGHFLAAPAQGLNIPMPRSARARLPRIDRLSEAGQGPPHQPPKLIV